MRAHQGEQGRNNPDENGLAFHILRPACLVIPLLAATDRPKPVFNEIDRLRSTATGKSVSKRRTGCIRFHHIREVYTIQSWKPKVLVPGVPKIRKIWGRRT